MKFRYRPLGHGWVAECTHCGGESTPYLAKSHARDWADAHTCPDDPKDAA